VRVEDKRQGPPKLHDLPSPRKLCGSRFGWPASKTLEVAQELYDGEGKKIITYPRAEVRYLPRSLISDVPRIVAGLQVGQSFSAIPVPDPPIIRKGASGAFYDKGLQGASHHAVIPNVNMIKNLREIWPRLSSDEKKLFDVIARAYLAALMPDFRYRQTTATLDVRGFEFRAAGRQGMAVYATEAKRVTDKTFINAAKAVTEQVTQATIETGLIYPPQSEILATSLHVARRVAETIFDAGLAGIERPADLKRFIERMAYQPEYRSLI